MKKIAAGLIGAMLLTSSVVYSSNTLPSKHARLKSSIGAQCPKTHCDKSSKQAANSECATICPANCPHQCK